MFILFNHECINNTLRYRYVICYQQKGWILSYYNNEVANVNIAWHRPTFKWLPFSNSNRHGEGTTVNTSLFQLNVLFGPSNLASICIFIHVLLHSYQSNNIQLYFYQSNLFLKERLYPCRFFFFFFIFLHTYT